MGNNMPKFDVILKAAIKIIGQKGFHNAKIKDIASEADVADGTIYNYFSNKEDILVTIFRIKLEDYVNKAKREIKGVEDTEKKLEILIRHHFKVMSENPDLAKVLQVELRQPNKEMRTKVRLHLKNYFNIIETVINDGIAKGIFKKNLHIHLAREMYFGTLDEVISTWVFSGQHWNLNAHVDELTEMFTKAFS
jgi:TetR/AcrR family fatty acid metabolism transcriptional regulator